MRALEDKGGPPSFEALLQDIESENVLGPAVAMQKVVTEIEERDKVVTTLQQFKDDADVRRRYIVFACVYLDDMAESTLSGTWTWEALMRAFRKEVRQARAFVLQQIRGNGELSEDEVLRIGMMHAAHIELSRIVKQKGSSMEVFIKLLLFREERNETCHSNETEKWVTPGQAAAGISGLKNGLSELPLSMRSFKEALTEAFGTWTKTIWQVNIENIT